MHFTVQKNAMEKALKNVSSSIQHKSIMPALGCVKIAVKEGKISMVTTTLEMETGDVVVGKIEKEGIVVAPIQTIKGIVSTMPSGSEIEFKLKDESGDILIISSGKRLNEIVCIRPAEFPDVLGGQYDVEIPLNAKDLSSAIQKISFAMSQAPERHNLNSIYMVSQEEEGKCFLSLVATDGHRLGFTRVPLKESISLSGKLLPRKAVLELIKLADVDSECSLGFSQNKARIKIGDMYFATKLVDASFPDYKKVVPQENDKFLELDAESMVSELKAISAVTQGKGAKLVIDSTVLHLSGKGSDGSITSTEVKCNFTGENGFTTTYNPGFIEDVLKVIDKDKNGLLKISFKEPNSPSLVQSASNTDSYYVIMPMKGD